MARTKAMKKTKTRKTGRASNRPSERPNEMRRALAILRSLPKHLGLKDRKDEKPQERNFYDLNSKGEESEA
jgi:hypothetical protein